MLTFSNELVKFCHLSQGSALGPEEDSNGVDPGPGQENPLEVGNVAKRTPQRLTMGGQNLLNLCMSVTESLIAHHTRVFSGSADTIIHLLLEDIFHSDLNPWLLNSNTFAGAFQPSDIPMR